MNRTLIISGLLASAIALTACDRVFQRPTDTAGTERAAAETPDAAAEPGAELPVRPESASSGAVIDWDAARRDLASRSADDLEGSFSVSKRVAVTAGVRYQSERDRVSPSIDDRKDSEAVYVGTKIRF